MLKTLYVTDLDGTLLDANARLSDTTVAGLHRLYDAGVPVTFITARTPATVQPIMSRALPHIPGVAMTGAALWHPTLERYERVSYHRTEDARVILDICRSHGVSPFVYTLPRGTNGLVVYHEAQMLTPVEQRFVDDRTLNHLKTFHLHTQFSGRWDDIVLYFAMGDPQAISTVAEEIRQRTGCYASCYPDTYNPGLALLEVFTDGVSKGEGLLELKQIVGADRVVAFGDNLNDIPMLEKADVAVAVDNAHPDVKAMADVVIGANTDDSVVDYIMQDSNI